VIVKIVRSEKAALLIKQNKKIQHSVYKAELERAKARQQTVKAKVMKRKRSSTVEPVWGTLINFMGMKRINARGCLLPQNTDACGSLL